MPINQLEKLNKIAEVLEDNKVSEDDFAQIIEVILKTIKDLKDTLEQDVANNKAELKDTVSDALDILKRHEEDMKEIMSKMEYKMAGDKKEIMTHCMKMVNDIKEVIPQMPDLKPLENKIAEIENKMPEMPKMPNLKPMEAKYEQLENDIKELKEKIQKVAELPRGRIGGMKKITYIKRINLTSQCNGVLKSFSLPKDTIEVIGVWGTQFPISFDTADFTLSGNTLTLTSEVSAPETGQTLFALVETLFYS